MAEAARTIGTDQVATRLLRRRLFGLPFVAAESLDDVVEELMERGASHHDRRYPVVATPNVDQLVRLDRGIDPLANRVVQQARYVLPDGQPIVWASRWLGAPLPSRLPGSSLVASLFPRVVAAKRQTLVVASSEGVAVHARSEGDHVAVVVAPPLIGGQSEQFETFIDECVAIVRAREVDFVFVGIGFPAQFHLIDGLIRRLQSTGAPLPLFLAVGASLEMHYGLVRRAPVWVQDLGLEWFFRFAQEPRRLFRRYFVDDLAFARLLVAEWRERRRGLRQT